MLTAYYVLYDEGEEVDGSLSRPLALSWSKKKESYEIYLFSISLLCLVESKTVESVGCGPASCGVGMGGGEIGNPSLNLSR